jgi:mono/diheme cytochrome c family protein
MTHSRIIDSLTLLSIVLWLVAFPVVGAELSPLQRGEYIFRATGGCTCHTDHEHKGALLAGGRPLKTPFGIVYSTNITSDPQTGIGNWSDTDFIKAMTEGIGPTGVRYFPVFPYTSFTRMTEQDLRDLKAYLFSIPTVVQENKPPELIPPFGWRFNLIVWNWFNFRPGTFQPDPHQSTEWNRGAYLVTALGHCAECHTPRNFMGGLKTKMFYAGSVEGPEGQLAPNITTDQSTGIGEWSIPDIVWFLENGLKPDGDDTQGLMSEMIEHGYKYLTKADLQAIAVYLKSLPPIQNKVTKKDKE